MDLYAELILDHAKTPHHAGLRAPFDAEVVQVNPVCGDEVTLRVAVTGTGSDAVVSDVSYEAVGCAISRASTSVLADLVIGRPVAEAVTTGDAIREMVRSRGQVAGDEDVIGDAVALAGVSRYPARVKCALLGWSALTDALARSGALEAVEGVGAPSNDGERGPAADDETRMSTR